MNLLQTIIIILSAIALFLHGLNSFSKEVQDIGSDFFKTWINKITQNRISGFLLGGLLTTIIQSSSAVSSITVALVDAGVISFTNSLAMLLGANVGTTTTAWLVSFKIGQIAPVFILLGTLISIIPAKIKTAGKSLFYFGFILFSLEFISQSLAPLKYDPKIVELLAIVDNHLLGILIGIILTIVVQSSSVTTGLCIILSQQGVLSIDAAVAIIIGSNIGSTSTALIASLNMSKSAKLSAKANFLFNLIGVVIFYPFINLFVKLISTLTEEIGYQIAFSHLIFNIIISLLMLPFIKQFGNLLIKKTKLKDSMK
jgi:phosphate:Na+ symporter